MGDSGQGGTAPYVARGIRRMTSTRSQMAYQAILDAIRAGVYPPGMSLREEDVAASIGVSRTPVREAFGRLRERGLLVSTAGRSAAVAELSMQQIFELYAMRQEMDGLAASFAARHATPVEIANLEQLNAEFGASADDPQRAAHWNRLFHARIYDAARNRYLGQAVEGVQEAIALLQDTTFSQKGRTELSAVEHAAIIAGIRSRDPEAARAAAIAHIQNAFQTRLQITQPKG